MNWLRLQMLAEAEVQATLAALPGPLRETAKVLPVIFERVPSDPLVTEGIERDTLGLFDGPELADCQDSTLPPQILLFLENIRDAAGGNETTFRDVVRTTYLHELGHYLGLDEDDLKARGLD